jgi:transcription initiation factor TFIIE subunit alpha
MLDEEENNMYFICPYGHYRLNFENASDPRVEFLCPECDAELVHDDNQDIIDDLKRRIKAIEDQM